MGSIISKINEQYDTYVSMCKIKKIKPMDIREKSKEDQTWYSIMNKWIEDDGCNNEYEWFKKQMIKMNMITSEEYQKIQHENKNLFPLDFPIQSFTIEEIQEFLSLRGYITIIKKGMAETVNTRTNEDMEVVKYKGGIKEVEDVFSIKEGQIIPDRFDSQEARNMQIEVVFQKELKHKILYE